MKNGYHTYTPNLAIRTARNMLYRHAAGADHIEPLCQEIWRFAHERSVPPPFWLNQEGYDIQNGKVVMSTNGETILELEAEKTWLSPSEITPFQLCDTLICNEMAIGLEVGAWQPVILHSNGHMHSVSLPKKVYSLQPLGDTLYMASLDGTSLFLTDMRLRLRDRVDISPITEEEGFVTVFPMRHTYGFLLKKSKRLILTDHDLVLIQETNLPLSNWFLCGTSMGEHILLISSFLSGANYCELLSISTGGTVHSLCTGLEDPSRMAASRNWLTLSVPTHMFLVSLMGKRSFSIPVELFSRYLCPDFNMRVQGLRIINDCLCITFDISVPGTDSYTRTMVAKIKIKAKK